MHPGQAKRLLIRVDRSFFGMHALIPGSWRVAEDRWRLRAAREASSAFTVFGNPLLQGIVDPGLPARPIRPEVRKHIG